MKHSDEEREHAYKIFHHLSSRDIYEGEGGGEGGSSEEEATHFKFHTNADVVLDVKGTFHARFAHPVEIW